MSPRSAIPSMPSMDRPVMPPALWQCFLSALGSSIRPTGDRIRSPAAGSRCPLAVARPLFGMPQSSGRVGRTPLARGRLRNTEKPLALSLSDEGDRLYVAPPALRTSRIAEVAFQVRLPVPARGRNARRRRPAHPPGLVRWKWQAARPAQDPELFGDPWYLSFDRSQFA